MTAPRYVVVGLGAIGGVVAAGLHRAGRNVVGVARGEHLNSIRSNGLSLHTPDGSETIQLVTAASLSEIDLGDDDVVLICTKSQDTNAVLQEILRTGSEPSVVCLQNGVENERLALRVLPNVYGAVISVPATHLLPGEVSVYCSPLMGVIEIGHVPVGVDNLCEILAEDFRAARFISIVRPIITASKYAKLLWNLGNAARAAFSSDLLVRKYRTEAQAEARTCFAIAGIECAENTGEDPLSEHGIQRRTVKDHAHPGGSTWQSLSRGSSGIETDYLNGEIVLLGRLHGVPTPVNQALVNVMREMTFQRYLPGSFDAERFNAMLINERATSINSGKA